MSLKPVFLALAVGSCTASYSIVDKLNLSVWSPLALLAITNVGFMLGLIPSVAASGKLKQAVRSQWRTILLGAVLSPGSYLLFLYAARYAQIAYIAPLREIGIVFGTVLGIVVLKEKHASSRLAASVIVLSGIVLIAVSGFK